MLRKFKVFLPRKITEIHNFGTPKAWFGWSISIFRTYLYIQQNYSTIAGYRKRQVLGGGVGGDYWIGEIMWSWAPSNWNVCARGIWSSGRKLTTLPEDWVSKFVFYFHCLGESKCGVHGEFSEHGVWNTCLPLFPSLPSLVPWGGGGKEAEYMAVQ
jgi:hypothetical protein